MGNVPAASTAVTTGVNALLASVDDIKADVLNCTKFQPIIEKAFHDGVCTEAVAGLYYIWQVVAAATVFTYIGIWLVPFATAAFKQQGSSGGLVSPTDPEKGIFGDQSEYDETGKLMEAAKAVETTGRGAGPLRRAVAVATTARTARGAWSKHRV